MTGRTRSRCPWAWRNPEGDDLYLCDLASGHEGEHVCTITWHNFTDGAFEQGRVTTPATPSAKESS